MAQSTLTPGPGTVVRDALALSLYADTYSGTAGVNPNAGDGWVNAEWPPDFQVVVTTGTVTGTSAVVGIIIDAADESDGTGLVTLGAFPALSEADDDQTLSLRLSAPGKRYLRARITGSGTVTSVPLTVKVRETHDRVGATTSAA